MSIKGLFALLAAGLLAVLLLRADYGFYSPSVGVATAGRDEVLEEPRERELLHISVTTADQKRLGGVPTVAKLSTFYGVEDSLPCSVQRTFDSHDRRLADRPRPPGSLVTLCLD